MTPYQSDRFYWRLHYVCKILKKNTVTNSATHLETKTEIGHHDTVDVLHDINKDRNGQPANVSYNGPKLSEILNQLSRTVIVANRDHYCRRPVAWQEGEVQSFTTGSSGANDTVTVCFLRTSASEGTWEGTASLVSNERECCAGVYEVDGSVGVVGVGVSAIVADTGVEGDTNVRHLRPNKHLTISVQAERELHNNEK